MLLILLLVAIFAVYIAIASRKKHKTPEPRPHRPTVAELRRRARQSADSQTGIDLLRRHTFVFVSMSHLERRLDHRIEDADGIEIGSALQYPRPTWWTNASGGASEFSEVHVEIRDRNDARIVKIVRPRGLFAIPLSVLDGSRVPVGTVQSEARRQFAIRDVLGRRLGTIRRASARYRVDCTIEDATGAEVGTISDLAHLAARLGVAGPRLDEWTQPDEHVLEITAPVSHDLRLLMLGAAAAVYLTLQRPETDDGA